MLSLCVSSHTPLSLWSTMSPSICWTSSKPHKTHLQECLLLGLVFEQREHNLRLIRYIMTRRWKQQLFAPYWQTGFLNLHLSFPLHACGLWEEPKAWVIHFLVESREHYQSCVITVAEHLPLYEPQRANWSMYLRMLTSKSFIKLCFLFLKLWK